MHNLETTSADSMPFTTDTAVDKFFHGGHWGQCLELLTHLCQYSDSIILVTGPTGIGKTALKEALIAGGTDKFEFCEIVATEQLDSDKLVDQIESGFPAAAVNSSEFSAQDHDLVLLLEDAQNLPINAISTLFQYKNNLSKQKIHIVLFADPQLEQKLQRSPLRDKFAELVQTIEIEPLTLNEVEAFVTHQQNLNGNADIHIDKATFKKIYSLSQGIPAAVKELTNTILTGRKVKRSNIGNKRLSPFSVGLTVTFGLVFCLLAFMWPDADDNTLTQASSEPIPDISVEVQKNSSISTDVQEGTNDSDAAAAQQELQPQIVESQAMTSLQEAIFPEASKGGISSSDSQQAQTTEQHEYDTYADKIARLENKLLALQQQVDQEQTARILAEEKVQQILQKAENTIRRPMPKAAPDYQSSKSLTKDEKNILSLPGKNYTLQLLGTSNEQKVKAFISEHKLKDKVYYFRTTYQGKPWYIVIYGNYVSRSIATAARDMLPAKLKKLQPWPREIVAVQRTIKKN